MIKWGDVPEECLEEGMVQHGNTHQNDYGEVAVLAIYNEEKELVYLKARFHRKPTLWNMIKEIFGAEAVPEVELKGEELEYFREHFEFSDNNDQIDKNLSYLSDKIEMEYRRNCSFHKAINQASFFRTISKHQDIDLEDVN